MLFGNLGQVIAGLAVVLGYVGQLLKLFPGQAQFAVFNGNQGPGQAQAMLFRKTLHQPGKLILGGAQLILADQNPGIEGAQLTIVGVAARAGLQVLQGIAGPAHLVEQLTLQYQCGLEFRFLFQQRRQGFERVPGGTAQALEQRGAVTDLRVVRVAVLHFPEQAQQFLLLLGWHAGGHGRQAVEVGIATQVQDLLKLGQCGFHVAIPKRLDGGSTPGILAIGGDIDPDIGQGACGTLAVQ